MKTIKTALLKLFLLSCIHSVYSQESATNDYLGKISLYVVQIENSERLKEAQRSKLESKVMSIATKNGVAGTGFGGSFLLYPKFEIYNENVVEGMQNMTVLDIELNLFIKQKSNNAVFSSYNKTFRGTGNSKDQAINNAISQINPNDASAKAFIEEGKNKIIQFYNSKCNDIILEADRYAGMNDFRMALAILTSVPIEATPCYEKIRDKSIRVYKLYLQKQCQSVMLLAKSQIAGNQYSAGLRTLATIDPTSNCYKEAQATIQATEGKIDADELKRWEQEKERLKITAEAEKAQWNAVTSVATSFFQETPSLWDTIWNFLF